MKFLVLFLLVLNVITFASEIKNITDVRDSYNDKLIDILYEVLEKNHKLKEFREDISKDLTYIKDKKIKNIFINAYSLEFISRSEVEPEEDYLPINKNLLKYQKIIRESKRKDIYFYMEELYPENDRVEGVLLTSGYVLDYIKRKIKGLKGK